MLSSVEQAFVGRDEKRAPLKRPAWEATVDVDVVESALRDVNLSSGRETVLKPEQESAVRALLADRDVLAVLRTGYGKSLIYQMFVRVKKNELKGNVAILVISPLKSISKTSCRRWNCGATQRKI